MRRVIAIAVASRLLMAEHGGRMTRRTSVPLALACLLSGSALGCTGDILDGAIGPSGHPGPGRTPGDPRDPGDPYTPYVPAPGDDALSSPRALGATPIARLTRAEYAASVRSLLGIDVADIVSTSLPGDGNERSPFDNDTTTQVPSESLASGLSLVAEVASERLLADRARRDALVGCAPSAPDDRTCMESFVRSFGGRAFRRPLTDEQVSILMLEHASPTLVELAREEGDFDAVVDVVVQSVLQDPHFVYRVEIGRLVEDDLVELDGYEIAARLSYFLWGDIPDPPLLALAASGALESPEGVRAEAERMLLDPRASARTARFHAMWLGYDRPIAAGAIGASMRAETDALLRRVIFEEHAPWTDIFTADETYVDAELAALYGLPMPAGASGPTWVSYGSTGRRGILSHTSFLSNGAKFGDTSPVVRGLVVRERMLCEHVPPPSPELGVNTDEAPGDPDACKVERYTMQHSTGGCAGCHSLMDPIGFGLERYDALGRYRTTEPDRDECAIEGRGEVVPYGAFEGPGELGALLAGEEDLHRCFTQQLFGFATGRQPDVAAGRPDVAAIDALLARFRAGELRLDRLLVEIAASPAFRHRVLPTE
jgi:hypothetical protein